MRFLRRHQNITLDDAAREALVAEATLFLESGLTFAEWDSFTEDEQAALVNAARALEVGRLTRLAAILRAQTPGDVGAAIASLDGGVLHKKAALDAAVSQAAVSLGATQFQEASN